MTRLGFLFLALICLLCVVQTHADDKDDDIVYVLASTVDGNSAASSSSTGGTPNPPTPDPTAATPDPTAASASDTGQTGQATGDTGGAASNSTGGGSSDEDPLWFFYERCFLGNGEPPADSDFCHQSASDDQSNNYDQLVVDVNTPADTGEADALAGQPLAGEPIDLSGATSNVGVALMEEKTSSLTDQLKRRHRHHHKHARHATTPLRSHDFDDPSFTQDINPYQTSNLWPAATVYFSFLGADIPAWKPVATATQTFSLKPLRTQQRGFVSNALMTWQKDTCLDFYNVAVDDTSRGALLISEMANTRRCATMGGPAFPGNGNQHLVVLTETLPKDDPLRSVTGTLGPDGCPLGSVMHELAHAVGIGHTMQRNDRDSWVEVHSDKFVGDDANNYKILTSYKDATVPGRSKMERAVNVYKSIMMYPSDQKMKPIISAFAKDAANPTSNELLALDLFQTKRFMGQRDAPNALDFATIAEAYGCFPLKLTNGPVDSVQIHPDQKVSQILKKISIQKGTPRDQIVLQSADGTELSDIYTSISPFVTDHNVALKVVLLSDTVSFAASNGKTETMFVSLDWKLPRLKQQLRHAFRWNVDSVSKSGTALTEDTSLSAQGVTAGGSLTVTLNAANPTVPLSFIQTD